MSNVEELEHIGGALKSPDDPEDFLAEAIYAPIKELNLPKTLDLRKDLQPVRDQGKQGSCMAFAATCIKEWHEKKDVGIDEFMSPQFIYNNRINTAMSGMYARDAMRILTDIGCCLERFYPYGTIEEADDIPQEIYDEASNYKIQNYAKVNTIDGIKKALYKDGPCMISFPMYNNSAEFWMPKAAGESRKGGHAVVIVGYNRKGFILRNSWDSSWNGDGHTLYPYDQFGIHWEVYTTVDAESVKPDLKPLGCMYKLKQLLQKVK